MLNLRLAPYRATAHFGGHDGDGVNDARFGSSAGGSRLDSDTLAVTSIFSDSVNFFTETDIVFNTGITWNSYRGPLRRDVMDLRRVALHELGHVIGLDHPDQHGIIVAAIMNSVISNIDDLTASDIDGAQFLYGAR